eukprot:CAMPEP_0206135828 /NCGR_PEP_ID=MMETSP1473-20131121/1093_1 /ASSEMBLY_ACC=CAM_ASM_001109 /TAXON_ID=1461547 /ORGANISM="Stichococcus sp, Strain RCC1054" /LENGTH=92 /DNA_ID=CAMNT_0053527943 /DNA_START=452 /DNA_END=731 /DNA_ORIENTATION=+
MSVDIDGNLESIIVDECSVPSMSEDGTNTAEVAPHSEYALGEFFPQDNEMHKSNMSSQRGAVGGSLWGQPGKEWRLEVPYSITMVEPRCCGQ